MGVLPAVKRQPGRLRPSELGSIYFLLLAWPWRRPPLPRRSVLPAMVQEVLLATILQAAVMHPPGIEYAIGGTRISRHPGASKRKNYKRTGHTKIKSDVNDLEREVIMPQVCTYLGRTGT